MTKQELLDALDLISGETVNMTIPQRLESVDCVYFVQHCFSGESGLGIKYKIAYIICQEALSQLYIEGSISYAD